MLREDERRHEERGGVVGDEGGEAGREEHHLPEDGLERLVLAEYPEGHDAQDAFPVVVVREEHHPEEEEDGLEAPFASHYAEHLRWGLDREDDHEGRAGQSSGGSPEREKLHIEDDEGPDDEEAEGAHDRAIGGFLGAGSAPELQEAGVAPITRQVGVVGEVGFECHLL